MTLTNPLAQLVADARERAFIERRDRNAPQFPTRPGLAVIDEIMNPLRLGAWRTPEQERAEWRLWSAEFHKIMEGGIAQ
jgi:hypothetical protein